MHALPVLQGATATRIPSADDMIDFVFAAGGVFAKAWPSYQRRKGQYDLAYAIDAAIGSDSHLIAEAPCGTGKSMAYLVPATYYASTKGQRVVVATGNIALQEQLVQKDLPLLKKLLPWEFSYALLKGVGHFLCRKKFPEIEGEIAMRERVAPEVAAEMKLLRDFIKQHSTDMSFTGDRSSLPFEPTSETWRLFSTNSEECTGTKCPRAAGCYSMKHREAASTADLVVTNYHMLFVDALVREASGGMASLLPPYQILIMDECHKAPDIAREFFGFSLSAAVIKRALGALNKTSYAVDASNAVAAVAAVFGFLRSEKAGFVSSRLIDDEAGDAWQNAKTLVKACIPHLKHMAAQHMAAAGENPHAEILAEKCFRGADRTALFCEQMDEALSLGNPEHVYSIEHGEKATILRALPVQIGALIRSRIINETKVTIATSATISTASNGGFGYMKNELGANGFRTLSAESPFNWPSQAIAIVVKGAPEPNDPSFVGFTGKALAATIRRAKGRTLALFTSYRALEAAHEHIAQQGLPYRIMRQGEMPRTRLIDEFRNDTSSVLLGTESFWTGVDVPGEALSCVFMDRLPFPHPDDPILRAIEAKSKDSFQAYSIPRAILTFKQGFGRLIRSMNDNGVFVLLDNRVHTKRYGKQFLNALPQGVPLDSSLNAIERVLT